MTDAFVIAHIETHLRRRFQIRGCRLERVTVGFSQHKKYIVLHEENPKFFVRLVPRKSRKRNYVLWKEAAQSVRVLNKILDVSYIREINSLCVTSEYVFGKLLSDALEEMNPEDRFSAGRQFGIDLLKLHQCSAGFMCRRRTLMNYWLHELLAFVCREKYDFQGEGRRMTARLSYLLFRRPKTVVHGDCSPRNIMYSEDGIMTLIDAESFTVDDPWGDLARLLFEPNEHCNEFADGMVHGYFCAEEPDDFRKVAVSLGWLYTHQYLMDKRSRGKDWDKEILEWASKKCREFM